MVFLQMCISRTPKAVRGDESLEGLGLEKHSLGHGGDAEGKGGEHDGLHFYGNSSSDLRLNWTNVN